MVQYGAVPTSAEDIDGGDPSYRRVLQGGGTPPVALEHILGKVNTMIVFFWGGTD